MAHFKKDQKAAEAAREAKNAYYKAWRAANKDRLKAYYKDWRGKNPDKVKRYMDKYWQKKAAQDGQATAAEGR